MEDSKSFSPTNCVVPINRPRAGQKVMPSVKPPCSKYLVKVAVTSR